MHFHQYPVHLHCFQVASSIMKSATIDNIVQALQVLQSSVLIDFMYTEMSGYKLTYKITI